MDEERAKLNKDKSSAIRRVVGLLFFLREVNVDGE